MVPGAQSARFSGAKCEGGAGSDLAILPAVDGAKCAPSVFDSSSEESSIRAPLTAMTLQSCEVLDGGAVWLRYLLQNE